MYMLYDEKLQPTYIYKSLKKMKVGEIFLNGEEFQQVVEKSNVGGAIMIKTKKVKKKVKKKVEKKVKKKVEKKVN